MTREVAKRRRHSGAHRAERLGERFGNLVTYVRMKNMVPPSVLGAFGGCSANKEQPPPGGM